MSRKAAQLTALVCVLTFLMQVQPTQGVAQILAGAAKVDVTDYEAGPVNDPLFVKALVLRSGDEHAVLVSVDAVAIGEIGRIGNDYLANVRTAIERTIGIPGSRILINASHCHGVVRNDIEALTVQVIQQAASHMEPVQIGVASGSEDQISENRRMRLKDGREIDVRHAYSMPPDDEVASVGPIDPEIGVLLLRRLDETASPLAVVYNFACHPIQGVPSGANTADLTGIASSVIEENLGGDAVALFLQGCGGDINPVGYKSVDQPRSAEPLGHRLGLSTLKSVRTIQTQPVDQMRWINETIELPRADLSTRIVELQQLRDRLVQSLQGTTLNLKTFLPLIVKYRVFDQFPSYYSNRYLHEENLGRKDLVTMDARNRADINQYVQNIEIMERLTQINTNLALLQRHQEQNLEAPSRTVDVELIGFRLGDFVLTTFPGELTVQIGLNLKQRSPHPFTFVAGYTNGYIYYSPTAEQLANTEGAQEDADCILAPHWQALYETKTLELLNRL